MEKHLIRPRASDMLREIQSRPPGFSRRVDELARRVAAKEDLWQKPLPGDNGKWEVDPDLADD